MSQLKDYRLLQETLLRKAYDAGFQHGLSCHGPWDDELQECVDRGATNFITELREDL